MTEHEAAELLFTVTSIWSNKQGDAIEWHPIAPPMAFNAAHDVENDTIELGFITAYALYDENVWGEGPVMWAIKLYGCD